jgi:hypothetical protein
VKTFQKLTLSSYLGNTEKVSVAHVYNEVASKPAMTQVNC